MPPDDSHSVYYLAHELRERGDFAGALERYEAYLAAPPPDAEGGKIVQKAMLGQVHCLNGLGDWLRMEAAARALTQAFPESAPGHLRLGEALLRQGRHAEAAPWLDRATRLDPGLSEAYALLQVAQKGGPEAGEPRRPKTWPPRTSRFADLKHLVRRYLLDEETPGLGISKEQALMTLGSCFAENLALRLQSQGYRVHHEPIGEEVNTTFANRYLLEWVELGAVSGPARAMEAAFGPAMRSRLMAAIADADVFVLTLGVAPCFFDKSTGEFVFSWSESTIGRDFLHQQCVMRTTTVAENVANISAIIACLRRLSGRDPGVVLTVSPVPLSGTTEFASAIIADCISKSTLRLACHEALAGGLDPRVHYWPSFEIVRWIGPHLSPDHPPVYGADDDNSRHVSSWLVDDIIDLFLERHAVGAGGQRPSAS
jgi:hypothetical protein